MRVTDAGKISFVMRRVEGQLLRRVVAEHRCGAEYAEGLLLRRAKTPARRWATWRRVDQKAKIANERAEEIAAQERAEKEQAKRKANSFGVAAGDFMEHHVLANNKG